LKNNIYLLFFNIFYSFFIKKKGRAKDDAGPGDGLNDDAGCRLEMVTC